MLILSSPSSEHDHKPYVLVPDCGFILHDVIEIHEAKKLCEVNSSKIGLCIGIIQIAIDKLDTETLAAHYIIINHIVTSYSQP